MHELELLVRYAGLGIQQHLFTIAFFLLLTLYYCLCLQPLPTRSRARVARQLCVQFLGIQQHLFTTAFFTTDSVLLPFYYAYLFGLLQLLAGLLLPLSY